MEDGLLYEASAREACVKKFKDKKIEKLGIFIHLMVPWLGYSADGMVCVCGWEN